jgi:NADH-quinone oxidoreductase subunit A
MTTNLLAQISNVMASDVIANAQIDPGDTNVELVFGILLFTATGIVFIVSALFAGSLIRPKLPHPEKASTYECGEPAIGDSWVQFDLRFYIVALFFIVFDVEIALLWPWAVVFRQFRDAGNGSLALFGMLFFLVPILVGFLYEWRFGYLDWVRSEEGQKEPDWKAPPIAASESLS